MSDFLNKLVTIVLVFIMLVVAPLLISYKSDDMMAKRLILNDVTEFIDKVKDTTEITKDDLNKLYVACNSHGLAVDVKVKKLKRVYVSKDKTAEELAAEGGVSTASDVKKIESVYYSFDGTNENEKMNTGDIVKVSVSEVGISTTRRIMYDILKISENKFQFSLAGRVG